MITKSFIWHAKRGHGECFLLLKNNISLYEKDVKKVFLNNYAFLKSGEYRSSYACELVSYYKNDVFFINLLWKKILRTKIDDFYTFDYLINNLYFMLKRNNEYDLTKKINKMLVSKLNKDNYTIDESNSICSLLSLIIDLKIDVDLKKIINYHFSRFEQTNLDVSWVEYEYSLFFERKKTNSKIDKTFLNNYELLLKHISNKESFNKELPIISTYLNDEFAKKLFNELTVSTDELLKTNILKVLYLSGKYNANNYLPLFKAVKNSNKQQKIIIYEMLSTIKTKTSLILLKSHDIDDPLFIRIALRNYCPELYLEIHKRIHRLRINYSDTDMWFEIEKDLINHFKKPNADMRLLVDLEYFLCFGLCSESRYRVVLILKKYKALNDNCVNSLIYDANVRIRAAIERLKAKN